MNHVIWPLAGHPYAYPLSGLQFFIVNQNSRYMGEVLASDDNSTLKACQNR